MFYVINKEKLKAYVVSIATVFVLFIMAGAVNPNGNTIETSANIQKEIKNNSINVTKDSSENNTINEISIENTNKTVEKTE